MIGDDVWAQYQDLQHIVELSNILIISISYGGVAYIMYKWDMWFNLLICII